MKPISTPWMLLAASLLCSTAEAAPGTLLRDESLRTQASASAAVSAKLGKGTAVDIVSRRGGWLQVRTAKAQGWVRLLSVRTGSGGAGGAGLGDVVGIATNRSNPSRVVAVAGVRGLDEEDLKEAKFSAEELARLESAAVSQAQVRANADKAGLVAVKVLALPKPAADAPSTNSSSENN